WGQQAEVARTQAEQAQDQAEEARRLAVKAQGETEQARRALDQVLYVQRVGRAYQEWRENHVARADELLADCPEALRHWEWRYVYRLCHSDLFTCRGHTEPVTSVCWSPDGTRLASASYDKTVKGWDAGDGQEALSLNGHSFWVNCGCWSPDGKRLASAGGTAAKGSPREVKVWDLERGQEAFSLHGHTGAVWSVCWSPDGTRLATASTDK